MSGPIKCYFCFLSTKNHQRNLSAAKKDILSFAPGSGALNLKSSLFNKSYRDVNDVSMLNVQVHQQYKFYRDL